MKSADDFVSIDWDKPYTTRDGREVLIYTMSSRIGNGTYPIRGEVKSHAGDWNESSWTKEGMQSHGKHAPEDDLVNVVPQKHTMWLHVLEAYKDRACGYLYESKQAAVAESKNGNSLAIIEVTFTDGEGL